MSEIIIPLYVFLFAYFILLALFVAYFLIILYHIIHSASLSFITFIVTFFIFASSALVLYATVNLLQGIDWQQPAIEFGVDSFDGNFDDDFLQ